MTLYLQICGLVLTAVVLILTLGSRGKEFGLLLGLGVCCLGVTAAMYYLTPVLDLVDTLEDLGQLDGNLIGIVLKIAGIGMISEIAALICADTGNAALGKTLQLLGSAVILWLSIPLFTMLTELLQTILGAL